MAANKFSFYMILKNPSIATLIDKDPLIRPTVDLETLGKEQRQGHLNAWRSDHTLEDVATIRRAAPASELVVRINPMHDGSPHEIDQVLARGADSLMLPMFHSTNEVARFVELINGRAKTIALFETAASVKNIDKILAASQIDMAHFGLNDLHLDLGSSFMFEPLFNGFLDEAARALRSANIPFGVGGLARASEGKLPPELILGEHVRLGSTGAILSRTFHRSLTGMPMKMTENELFGEIEKLRDIFNEYKAAPNSEILANQKVIQDQFSGSSHS